MELLLKFIPTLVIIFISIFLLLPLYINNRKNNNSKWSFNMLNKYSIFSLIILFFILTILGFILSKTVSKENHENNLMINNAVETIVKNIYNDQIEIEFIKSLKITTTIYPKPKNIRGIYIYEINTGNSKDTIKVYWKINEEYLSIETIEKNDNNKYVKIYNNIIE